MIELIKRLIFAWQFKQAVRKADRMRRLTRMKYLVLMLNGKLKVVAKQDCRRLIRQRYFKKGTRIEDIEKRALYTTK
ncbi:hypothetical protein SAMN05216354_0616 [Xylanibacter ruminicola]|uniref:Uncharacterized protein n=1 Tax=Xylanibacter ruminicola TaxID=839 RepID=A0A1H5SC56_XYLRU|nr:hypothetical protein [Xylanibacter ruminicola]SEF48162.1 hypothetical protein SAMN05216354_0616 [Xylanibacter ruminicola]